MSDLKLFEFEDYKIRTALEDGKAWFVVKDVCKALDIAWSGSGSTMGGSIKPEWQRLMKFQTAGGIQELRVISEPAVYKLAFRSNKPQAERFTDWIAESVIPQIRRTGKYVPRHQGVLPLLAHTSNEVQKDMSKSVNSYNFERGGVDEVKAYNLANCVTHTGKTPAQLKSDGKRKGLKSKDRNSGKAVARVTQPAAASCMSVADNLYEQGFNLHRVFEVSKSAEPFFEKVIALGVRPAELKE